MGASLSSHGMRRGAGPVTGYLSGESCEVIGKDLTECA